MNQEEHWNQLAYKKYDLNTCESEPLAFCGAVQPVGVFVGCRKQDGHITTVSMNADEFLGLPAQKMLNQKPQDIFVFANGEAFDLDRASILSKSGPILMSVLGNQDLFYATVSQNKSMICIDIEKVRERGRDPSTQIAYDPVQDLKHMVHLLDEETDLDQITQKAADQIRIITGFDRVMVYKFEGNWDGQVVAESLNADLEPYLGLYYPASDIPAQARLLYFESKYRMIVDTESLPVPIVTAPGLGKSEVDLSCCGFRAVSPIHIQYMQNMGVRASFSLPIKLNGTLWGLVSCHGYDKPFYLSKETRAACELGAQVLSGRIADSVNERRLKIKNQVFELTQTLLANVAQGYKPMDAFRAMEHKLLSLANSSGALVRFGGEELRIGQCPDTEYLAEISAKLVAKPSLALWESTSLAEDLGIDFKSETVGALAVPLSLGFEDLIIWFRPEFIREVKWGGKPNEQKAAVKKLEPRASFKAWTETVKGRSQEWKDSDREAAQYLLFTFVQGIFKKAGELSKANVELEKATRTKDEFIGMVSHELRTPLGVMIGWIDVLKDYQFKDEEITQALEVLERNAKLQVNLINDLLDISRIISGKMRINPEANIDICAVTQEAVQALKPTAMAKGITLECQTCESIHAVADSERLRQVIWNLITNSIKFTPKGGRVTASVALKNSKVEISVQDTGIGIPPQQLGRIFNRFEQIGEDGARTGGLGLGLSIVRSLVELHGGEVFATSEGPGKGSTFTVQLPVYALKREALVPAPIPLIVPATQSLKGLRILLAEDQADSATAMGHILRRQGAEVLIAQNGQEAFEFLKAEKFDLILSDIGMPKWDGYKLITEWRVLEHQRQAQPIPAIALTAYATSQDRTNALKAGFQSHIPKPLDKSELLAVIESLGIEKLKK